MSNLHLKQPIVIGLSISRAMEQTKKKKKKGVTETTNSKTPKVLQKVCLSYKKPQLSMQETINS